MGHDWLRRSREQRRLPSEARAEPESRSRDPSDPAGRTAGLKGKGETTVKGRRSKKRAAFTLLEVLLVVALLAILASVVVPAAQTQQPLTLEAAARRVASDLRYARNLAIQYGTPVTVQFDTRAGTYDIRWAGDVTAPMPRPWNPTLLSSDGNSIHHSLNPHNRSEFGRTHFVFAAIYRSPSQSAVDDVTFGPTGGTGPARNEDTIIWVGLGRGEDSRFIRIRISWVTGLVWVGSPTSQFLLSAARPGDRVLSSLSGKRAGRPWDPNAGTSEAADQCRYL